MTRYLIFGNGFIGNRFFSYLPVSRISTKRILGINDVLFEIEIHNAEVVINCIGKTGNPNVDWCEDHREETFFSNVTVPSFIAEACKEANTYMVHLGSGCIYEGDKNYTEEDAPNFKGSFYSRTKLYSEQILRHYDNVLQLRIRMPVDVNPSPKNLITKLIGYRQVISVPNSITCIPDLMEAAYKLMENREIGIFNVVNKGSITHKEILEMYRDIVDPEFIMPAFIPVEKLATAAPRSNCTLSTMKLDQKGIEIRPAKKAVAVCMNSFRFGGVT